MNQSQLSLRQRGRLRLTKGRITFHAPVVGPTKVCLFSREGVWAIARDSLEVVWHRTDEWAWLKAVARQHAVIAPDDMLQAVDWSGEIRWQRDKAQHTLVAGDGRLFEVREGVLSLVDVETGAGTVLGGSIFARPDALCGDILLLKQDGSDTYSAFELPSRRHLWAVEYTVLVRELLGRELSSRAFSVGPSTVPGCFVFAHEDQTYGASVVDGRILWRAPVQVPNRAPRARDGRIYTWSTSVPMRTTTFDLSTSQIVREVASSSPNRFVMTDAGTGAILLDRDLAEYGFEFAARQLPQFPAFGRNHVVVTTDAGLLAIFRLSDGELVGRHRVDGGPSAPAVDGNEIYVPCEDGSLYVFGCEGGDL